MVDNEPMSQEGDEGRIQNMLKDALRDSTTVRATGQEVFQSQHTLRCQPSAIV